MDEPFLPPKNEEKRKVGFDKNNSQAVLPDNELAQMLRQPQGFRRHFLISKAIRKGLSFHAIPLLWKIPFMKKFEQLDIARLANILGDDYIPTEGSPLLLTYFSLVKSMICTAILFVPRGFMLGGWLFSTLCFMVVAVVYMISIIWLGQARDAHRGTYAELGRKAMGSVGYYAVELSIFLTQLGFFVVTCVFFNSNLQNVAAYLGLEVSLWVTGLIQFLLICPLIVIKKVSDLTLTHLIGDVLIIVSLIYIAVGDINILSTEGAGPGVTPFNPETALMLVGMSFYSYEGIALILPIKSAMQEPQKFWIVASLMMFTVTSLIVGFGLINNFTFGTNTEQIVTLNIEMNTGTTILILLYLVAVLFTHPMLLFPPLTTIDMWMGEKASFFLTSAARIAVVGVLSAAAVLLNDKADKYISLLGSLLCGPLAYIFPAIINLKLKSDISFFGRSLSFLFIGVGVVSCILCAGLNLRNW